MKEYNINALFERLTVDLENHIKDKLLSAASGSLHIIFPYSVRMRENTDQKNCKFGHFSRSGSFDSFNSKTFLRKSKKVGYIRPTELQKKEMLRKTICPEYHTEYILHCRYEYWNL